MGFSRTAVNVMFGATSQLGCAFSSILVLVAVFLLLDYIYYIPYACLAPIIIQGAIGVMAFHDFQVAWKASKGEFFVMFATFVVSLGLTVKEGLLAGFLASVLVMMYSLANPDLAVLGQLGNTGTFHDVRLFPSAVQLPSAVIVRIDARVNFTNSRKMKEFCLKVIQVRHDSGAEIEFFIVDGKSINHVDLTGCEMLEQLATTLEEKGIRLIIANLAGPVVTLLIKAKVPDHLGHKGGVICLTMTQALDIVNGNDPTVAGRLVQNVAERTAKVAKIQAHTLGKVAACCRH
eukprot:NODE_1100_length_1240_cov_323.860759.p1 GENE.NODE_1100_length_1240_cov_323.860759~~NODE_1100_length_1240_cov_323.860759.p1  ORF type:complete len:290 (+),score=71.51 NODE_1100_length_1240_cov_323.860759:40-909(+)